MNFRVSGRGNDWISVQFEVPRNRDIDSYELRRYEHNGSEYVTQKTTLATAAARYRAAAALAVPLRG